MPGANLPHDQAAQTAALARRLEDLERPSRVPGREGAIEELRFSQSGAVAVMTSGPDEARMTGQLIAVICRLGTAGTSNTVVTVYRNGTSIGTVTLASGALRVAAYLGNYRIAAETDVMTVGITTAGTGAKDLTVKLRLRS